MMISTLHEHDWLAPSPFWGANDYRQVDFYRPALFELRSDDFMDEFLDAAGAPSAAQVTEQLSAHRLAPLPSGPNKLFQPAHGRFYLAAASLCCRTPGFPDRELVRAEGESAGFVLRKLVGGKEYAWVPEGPGVVAAGWQPVGDSGRSVLKGEERLPAFVTPLAGGRRIFCGYVPVSSSQTYGIQPKQLAVSGQDEPRVQELGSRFIAPLYEDQVDPANPLGPPKSQVDLITDNTAAWTTSVYLVLELWEYLETHLPDVAAAVKDDTTPAFSGDTAAAQAALLTFLRNQTYRGSLSLAEALQEVAAVEDALNAPGGGDLNALGLTQNKYSLKNQGSLTNSALDALRNAVKPALPAVGEPVKVPKLDVSTGVHYALRFVYERPQCSPAPGKLGLVEVSQPSQPFVFAPFFDADAPARPVRIPLPSDVSIAGLRKAGKNVSFMMSDAMRKKMGMLLGKEKTLLGDNPDPNPEGGLDFAFICSFSIQIIFIIAFMLLLIFVIVFNIIFWWLAFFKICLPVPKSLLPD